VKRTEAGHQFNDQTVAQLYDAWVHTHGHEWIEELQSSVFDVFLQGYALGFDDGSEFLKEFM
jgi:hypothetical protein